MRIGILGGSFDPVHYGHLLLAESCREQCALDRVWLMPASVPPHKLDRGRADPKHRVEMLKLAIAGNEQFEVSTIEIDRKGISYTVDTLTDVARQQEDATLHLLMGGDSLRDLPTWREPERILQLAIPTVVRRAGGESVDYGVLREFVSAEQLDEIQRFQVEMPQIELSSTDIRRRVASDLSIRFRMPRAVEKYIETHGLYRSDETA